MLTMDKSAAKPAASGNPRAHWPAELQKDFNENEFSGCVGSVLVSETDKVRVWHLTIPAGRRCSTVPTTRSMATAAATASASVGARYRSLPE